MRRHDAREIGCGSPKGLVHQQIAIVRAIDRADEVREWPDYAWRCVVKAVARAFRRWKQRQRIEAQGIESEGGRGDPADRRLPLCAELPYEVRECLPPGVLEAAELVAVHGYTREEAADRLGVNKSTITRRLQVAAERIRGETGVKMRHANAHHGKRKAVTA